MCVTGTFALIFFNIDLKYKLLKAIWGNIHFNKNLETVIF